MNRSHAVHDGEACGGLQAHCDVCLDSLWRGQTPVMTPLLDAFFGAVTTVVVVIAVLYLAVHIAFAVIR